MQIRPSVGQLVHGQIITAVNHLEQLHEINKVVKEVG